MGYVSGTHQRPGLQRSAQIPHWAAADHASGVFGCKNLVALLMRVVLARVDGQNGSTSC